MYTLDASIHSSSPGLGLAGPAFTVLAEAGSIITVHKALLGATAGTVLVVGGETARGLDGALFGKLMAIQAKLRGIVGLVVDGQTRDVAGLRELEFPVFARSITPRVGVNRTVGQTQVLIPCGGFMVGPGDYVRGDDDGITVIPAALLAQVVTAVEQRLQKEAEYIERVHTGEHISDLIGFRQLIYQTS
jgi:4-hydroxy-4-methyl-2-oxoglutarate aldolase